MTYSAAQRFKLGGSYAHGEKAIAIPYFDQQSVLVGGRWRMINPTNQRYHAWKGSNLRHGFGWHTHNDSETIVICEGEFNAISIAQTKPDIDVLSMGSENSSINAEVAQQLTNHKRIILWSDSQIGLDRWTKGLPNHERTFITQTIGGVKCDANELLKHNELFDMLTSLINRKIGSVTEQPNTNT